MNTYIEVGAESSEDDGGLRLVGEEEHFRLANVVGLEHIVVGLSDIDCSISDEPESRLFELVCVDLFLCVNDIDVRDWARRVDSVCWELSDSCFVADLFPLGALDSPDPEHLVLFNAELLKLSLISLGCLIYEYGQLAQ